MVHVQTQKPHQSTGAAICVLVTPDCACLRARAILISTAFGAGPPSTHPPGCGGAGTGLAFPTECSIAAACAWQAARRHTAAYKQIQKLTLLDIFGVHTADANMTLLAFLKMYIQCLSMPRKKGAAVYSRCTLCAFGHV